MQKILALIRYGLLRLFKPGVSIPRLSYIGPGCTISRIGKGVIKAAGKIRADRHAEMIAQGKITVGDNFVLNGYSRIIAHEHIEIGNNVVIARYVTILDHDHAYKKGADGNIAFDGYVTAPIRIGNNVWMGDKVSILKGVNIGNNVIVGANAVVTKNIPANCIAAGNPARVIKHL